MVIKLGNFHINASRDDGWELQGQSGQSLGLNWLSIWTQRKSFFIIIVYTPLIDE